MVQGIMDNTLDAHYIYKSCLLSSLFVSSLEPPVCPCVQCTLYCMSVYTMYPVLMFENDYSIIDL